MANKKVSSKDIVPRQMNWEEFAKIQDEYIGNLAEFEKGAVIYRGTIVKLELQGQILYCYCIDSQIFKGTWEPYIQAKEVFFKSSEKPPLDLGYGTIKINTSIGGNAYLKLNKKEKKRA